MAQNYWRRFIALTGLALSPALLCAAQEQTLSDPYEKVKSIVTVLNLVETAFVYPIDSQVLVDKGLKRFIEQLDAYSEYLTAEEYQSAQEDGNGQFAGIGVEVIKRDGQLTVVAPFPGSPAQDAGIKANDRILMIDGVPAEDLSLDKAVRQIRGPQNKELCLTIEQDGQLKQMLLERKTVKAESVKDMTLIDQKWAYLKITQFQKGTALKIKHVLKQMEALKARGVILDLRNNSGGVLAEAVQAAELFLRQNKQIVSVVGRKQVDGAEFRATSNGAYRSWPVVCLINQGTASAAEVLSGALKDHKQALLVGEKSFGKGSVQTLIPLPSGAALRLTTHRYVLPEGGIIDRKGIMPDYAQDLEGTPIYKRVKSFLDGSQYGFIDQSSISDKQLQAAVEVLERENS